MLVSDTITCTPPSAKRANMQQATCLCTYNMHMGPWLSLCYSEALLSSEAHVRCAEGAKGFQGFPRPLADLLSS